MFYLRLRFWKVGLCPTWDMVREETVPDLGLGGRRGLCPTGMGEY
jgi:hypothetical protein